MASLNTTPWNILLFSVFCFSASFLIYRVKDGLHLWLAAAFVIIPLGCWLAKINPLVAIGDFIASSIASLFLSLWLADRVDRASRKSPNQDPKSKQ
jgi:hypothetical protein